MGSTQIAHYKAQFFHIQHSQECAVKVSMPKLEALNYFVWEYKRWRVPYMVNLVGEFGCGLEVPGNEGSVCRVPAHTVGAGHKLHTTSEKQDV